MLKAPARMYPVLLMPDDLPPWDGPFPYSSLVEPAQHVPIFSGNVPPEEVERYHRWLRLSRNLPDDDLVVIGVTVSDVQSLAPEKWLVDSLLHYFAKSVKSTLRIQDFSVVYVPSFFLTLLFNEGHVDSNVEHKFAYENVKSWEKKRATESRKPINEIDTFVFFYNEGRMHWYIFTIFQDLKIIQEFNSTGNSIVSTKILRGLFLWLSIEYVKVGLTLDPNEWRLYGCRRSTSRQRNGYDCGVYSIFFALCSGFRLNLNNLRPMQITRARFQMLLHLINTSDVDYFGVDHHLNLPIDLLHLRDESEDDDTESEELGNIHPNLPIDLAHLGDETVDKDTDSEKSASIDGLSAIAVVDDPDDCVGSGPIAGGIQESAIIDGVTVIVVVDDSDDGVGSAPVDGIEDTAGIDINKENNASSGAAPVDGMEDSAGANENADDGNVTNQDYRNQDNRSNDSSGGGNDGNDNDQGSNNAGDTGDTGDAGDDGDNNEKKDGKIEKQRGKDDAEEEDGNDDQDPEDKEEEDTLIEGLGGVSVTTGIVQKSKLLASSLLPSTQYQADPFDPAYEAGREPPSPTWPVLPALVSTTPGSVARLSTFGSLDANLPLSPIVGGLLSNMERPALEAIANAFNTPSPIAPVVDALSVELSIGVAESVARQLLAAEQLNTPFLPNLEDVEADEKTLEVESTDYGDGYSDDNDGLLEGVDATQEEKGDAPVTAQEEEYHPSSSKKSLDSDEVEKAAVILGDLVDPSEGEVGDNENDDKNEDTEDDSIMGRASTPASPTRVMPDRKAKHGSTESPSPTKDKATTSSKKKSEPKKPTSIVDENDLPLLPDLDYDEPTISKPKPKKTTPKKAPTEPFTRKSPRISSPTYSKHASMPAGAGGGGDGGSNDSDSDTNDYVPPIDLDDDESDKKPAAKPTQGRGKKGDKKGDKITAAKPSRKKAAERLREQKEKQKAKKKESEGMKAPTKITDTTAIFTYLELQSEKRHVDTIEQRTKNFKKITSEERSKMTPEKIKQLRQARMNDNSVKRALRQTKRQDHFLEREIAEAKRFKSQAGARSAADKLFIKHFDKPEYQWERKGKTVDRKRYKKMAEQLTNRWRDRRSGSEKKIAQHLKNTERKDLDQELRYEKEINEIDSLMYFPVDWGDEGPPTVDAPPRQPKVKEHFNGLMREPDGVTPIVVFDIRPEWVEFVFQPVFVELVKKQPFIWWPVVVGNAKIGNLDTVPSHLMTTVKVEYPQGDKNQCLFKSVASALHYCKQVEAASYFSNAAPTVQYLPRDKALKSLREGMEKHAPAIGGVIIFNQKQKRRTTKHISIDELIDNKTKYPTVVIPRGNDGSASHAVVVVDDIIFDATQLRALKLSRESFDWICGERGCGDIATALRFHRSVSTKKVYNRTIEKNW